MSSDKQIINHTCGICGKKLNQPITSVLAEFNSMESGWIQLVFDNNALTDICPECQVNSKDLIFCELRNRTNYGSGNAADIPALKDCLIRLIAIETVHYAPNAASALTAGQRQAVIGRYNIELAEAIRLIKSVDSSFTDYTAGYLINVAGKNLLDIMKVFTLKEDPIYVS